MWKISLDPRLLREGTYFEFEMGKAAAFAVEFFSLAGLKILPAPKAGGFYKSHQVSARFIDDSEYEVQAKILFVGEDYWVIDMGIHVFCEGECPEGAKVGDCVGGRLALSVDSFFYFQYASKDPDVLPLVYDWKVNEISEVATPNEKLRDEKGREFFYSNPATAKTEKVLKTNAQAKRTQEMRVDYILGCEVMGQPRFPVKRGITP